MEMKKSNVIVLCLIFFLTVSVIPTSAYWIKTDSAGNWDYQNHNSWKSPYDKNYSYFEYKMNQTSFNRWSFVVRLIDYEVGGLWEIEKCTQLFNATLCDGESWTHKIEILVGHECSIHIFGIKTVKTWIQVKIDGQVEPIIPIQRNMDVEIHIWRSSTDILSITYIMKYDYTQNEANFYREGINKTVGSSWFSNVDLKQRVEKQLYSWGYAEGMIQGEKVQEVIGSGGAISKPYSFRELTLAEQIGSELWRNLKGLSDMAYNSLPENIREFLDNASKIIYDFGLFVFSLFNILVNILISNIPLVLGAYGLYLLYIIFKAIDKGDFSILFEHFISISKLFIAIGNTVLSVVRTIISLVKWW